MVGRGSVGRMGSRGVGGRGIGCGGVGRSSMVRGGMVGGGVVKRGRVVGICMLLVLWLGQVGVLVRVRVQLVEAHGLATVNLVPELAGELVLVEEGAVGADEAGALGPVPSVVAHTVNLTSCLWVGVHAGLEGSVGAAELGVGGLSQAGVVHAGLARHAVLVVVMVLLVVGVRVVGRLGLVVGLGRGVVGSRLMVGGLRGVVGGRFGGVVRSWLMISRGRGAVRSWLMVGRCRGAVRGGLMVGGLRGVVGSRLMIGRSRRTVRSRLMVGGLRGVVGGRLVVSRCGRAVRSRLMVGGSSIARLVIGGGMGGVGLGWSVRFRCVGGGRGRTVGAPCRLREVGELGESLESGLWVGAEVGQVLDLLPQGEEQAAAGPSQQSQRS